ARLSERVDAARRNLDVSNGEEPDGSTRRPVGALRTLRALAGQRACDRFEQSGGTRRRARADREGVAGRGSPACAMIDVADEEIAMSGAARRNFGAENTTEDVLAGIDLSGRAAIVTGASGGLGEETARALASRGCAVTLAARDAGKAEKAGL